MSLPRVLLLVLALVHATGLAEVMRRQVCEAECRNDGCGNDCTPGTESPSCPCHCPGLQSNLTAAITAVAVVPAARPVPLFEARDGSPPSPDPHEIWHVPRRDV